MAVNNWIDYSKAPIQDSPISDVFESALKGYKMQQEPAKMGQEKQQRALANALQDLALKHKPKEYEMSDALKQAQINKANRPAAPEKLKGALAQAFQLRDSLDKNSENYKQDLAQVNNYINKLGTQAGGAAQMQPGKGIQINLPEGKIGYIPGIGNVQKGWQVVKDAEGKDIGVNVPMTAKAVDQWKAKEKFDIIYPFLNSSLSEYTGQNSWERFTSDAAKYNVDQAAKKRIDDFFAAKKLISIGSTTENARIGGHATNVQLDELKKTLDSSEVFKKIEKGSGFVLPGKYAKNSGDIFKSYLDKVEKTAKTNIPAYEYRALNPNENNASAPEQAQMQASSAPEIVGTSNGFTTIKNDGKTFKIPQNLVQQYMMEHGQGGG